MNTSIIRYIVGYILKIEAALLLIPSIVAAITANRRGYVIFLFPLCASSLVYSSLSENRKIMFFI